MEFTDEQLTEIYKVANNKVGKARPLTTQSIFSAMRAIARLVEQETLERAAVECDKRARVVLEHEEKIVKERGFTPAWEWTRSARTTSQRCANSIRALMVDNP